MTLSTGRNLCARERENSQESRAGVKLKMQVQALLLADEQAQALINKLKNQEFVSTRHLRLSSGHFKLVMCSRHIHKS